MPTSGVPARYLRQAPKNISRTSSRDGLNILGLLPEFAQVADHASRAAGLAREADVAPVQDQPMVRVLEELGGRELEELLLHLERVLVWREPGPIGDAEDMRIYRYRQLPEGGIEDHVRGLAAHPRQPLERLALGRHLASVLFHEDLGEGHEVLRFRAVQPYRPNVFFNLGNPEVGNL